VKLFIHPVWILSIALAVYYSATVFLVALVLAVIIHELSHGLVAIAFGITPTRLSILPFGGQIDIDCDFLSRKRKDIVLLAGPAGNFVLSVIFGVLVWLFPTVFIYLEYIVTANFITGIMNLLPLSTLDGGKILSNHINGKIVLIFSNIVFAVVLMISIYYLNLLWIGFTVIMLISINLGTKTTKYVSKFRPKTGKVIEFAVNSKQTLFSVYKMLPTNSPAKFIITDKNNRVFYENDLELWLNKYSVHTKIFEIIY